MPIRTRMRPCLPDAADEMVLECAVQAGVAAIVTMNVRHFRPAAASYRVEILKPGELLRKLNSGE
jgi:predicted nucleic acid-binding protein